MVCSWADFSSWNHLFFPPCTHIPPKYDVTPSFSTQHIQLNQSQTAAAAGAAAKKMRRDKGQDGGRGVHRGADRPQGDEATERARREDERMQGDEKEEIEQAAKRQIKLWGHQL